MGKLRALLQVTQQVMTHPVQGYGWEVVGWVHAGSGYPLPKSQVPIASASPRLSLAQETSFHTCGKGSWSLLIRRIQREESDSRPHPWLGESVLPKLHSRCQDSGNKTQLDSFVVTSASTILFLCFNSLVIHRPLTGRRNGIQNFSLENKIFLNLRNTHPV